MSVTADTSALMLRCRCRKGTWHALVFRIECSAKPSACCGTAVDKGSKVLPELCHCAPAETVTMTVQLSLTRPAPTLFQVSFTHPVPTLVQP